MRRRTFLAGAGGGAVLLGSGLVGANALTGANTSASAADDAGESSRPTTASVMRDSLTDDREFRATVSFGDGWALPAQMAGLVTATHERGTVVGFGEELIRVNNRPVFLAQGAMPMYRELYEVDTSIRDENGERGTLLEGFDVVQLQAFLLDAGFDDRGRLEADGTWRRSTTDAVKAWQRDLGLRADGRVDGTLMIFSPAPVRIDTAYRVGDPFGELRVTKPDPTVFADASNRDRPVLAVGTTCRVVLLDGTSLDGEVVTQEQTVGADGSRVWRSTVEVQGDLPRDTSSATLNVTNVIASGVLVVPASALLALADGGFALERPTGDGTELVRVEVGEVLDGRAEVTGDITEGDDVVVPE